MTVTTTNFNFGELKNVPPDDKPEYQPIKPGFYRGIITSSKFAISQSGNPMIKVEVRITGDAKGQPSPVDNRTLTTHLTRTSDRRMASRFFLEPLSSILGLSHDELDQKYGGDIDGQILADDLLKEAVSISVKDGKPKPNKDGEMVTYSEIDRIGGIAQDELNI